MTGVTIRRLETRSAVAEIHLARDAGADHPLQRAVHGGAPDARILATDEIAQIVRAQMTLLADEDIEDSIALGGALAAGWPQARNVGKRTVSH